MRIAITGGAGFVGSNLAVSLIKRDEITEVIALDNLYRRGSERNVNLLTANGVKFVYGDVRQKADIEQMGDIDVMVECSAEPSVLAGFEGSPRYLIDTNLAGAINCLEFCREVSSRFIFLSSSRVYPHQTISNIPYKTTEDKVGMGPFDLRGTRDLLKGHFGGIRTRGTALNVWCHKTIR